MIYSDYIKCYSLINDLIGSLCKFMLNINLQDKTQIYQLIVGIAAVTAILAGCLVILSPFFPAILLAAIFALSAWPAFDWLKAKLNHRTGLAATLMTLLLALCFLAPLIIIGTSTSDNFAQIFAAMQASLQGDTGQIADWVSGIPYIGDDLARYWAVLTSDRARLQEIMQEYAGPTSQWLIKVGGVIGRGVIDITLGVIFAYFFFRHGTHAAVRLRNLIDKFGGERGQHLLQVSKNTLIGVVYGILGTALAQGALAAFGFWMANVPGASFLGLLTFFLSFIPMGPPLIWGPAAIWLITEGHTYWAGFLLAWGLFVISAIDNILKPYFISIGSNLPFMLVLIGIGGGVIAFGFIGIFIGPTLLALSYSILLELSSAKKSPPPALQPTAQPVK